MTTKPFNSPHAVARIFPKCLQLAAGCAAALLCLPQAAHATDLAGPGHDSHYWSVQAGVNTLSRWPARVSHGGPAMDAELRMKNGAQFGLAVGRQRQQARYELEYQRGRIRINEATIGPVTDAVDASGHYDVLTANALHHAPINPSWSVYAGLGVGVARVNLPKISLDNGCQCLGAASKTGFAWQARGGTEWRLDPSSGLFAQLGWLSVPGPSASAPSVVSYPRKGFGVVGLGFRKHF